MKRRAKRVILGLALLLMLGFLVPAGPFAQFTFIQKGPFGNGSGCGYLILDGKRTATQVDSYRFSILAQRTYSDGSWGSTFEVNGPCLVSLREGTSLRWGVRLYLPRASVRGFQPSSVIGYDKAGEPLFRATWAAWLQPSEKQALCRLKIENVTSGPITVINRPQLLKPCYPTTDERSLQDSDLRTLSPGEGIEVSEYVNAWQRGCGFADHYTGDIRVAKGDHKTLKTWESSFAVVRVTVDPEADRKKPDE